MLLLCYGYFMTSTMLLTDELTKYHASGYRIFNLGIGNPLPQPPSLGLYDKILFAYSFSLVFIIFYTKLVRCFLNLTTI